MISTSIGFNSLFHTDIEGTAWEVANRHGEVISVQSKPENPANLNFAYLLLSD
jgi:hypothetical protein